MISNDTMAFLMGTDTNTVDRWLGKDCEHLHVTPLSRTTKIGGFDNPITCDDCGEIIECEHEEIEHTELPYCTACGDVVFNEDNYYGI